MKKGFIICSVICLVLVLILSSIVVFAQRGTNEREKGSNDQRIEQKTRIIDEEGNVIETRIRIEERKEDGRMMRRFRVKDVEANSELDIREETEGNRSRIRVKLRDGDHEIKVMPDRASAIAIERLKSLNFTVELREVGIGNGSSRAIYFVETNKTGRFLGIVKMKMRMHAEVDSETGEIKVRKRWWAFLVSGEDNDETREKVILCHIPPGDPASAHTITVGAPAMRAHLAHGDTLGACEGSPPQNDTTPPQNNTQPPQNNTTPPQNTTNTTNQNTTVNVNAGIGVNPNS